MSTRRFSASRRAFTLIEVAISASIFLVVVGLTMGIVLAVAKLNLRTEQKENLNEDFRRMAQVISDVGRTSSAFQIHPAYNDRARAVGDGESGDLLVFVSYAAADVTGDPNNHSIARIVGVYLDSAADPNAPKSLRWFDSKRMNWGVSFPAPGDTPIANLLPSASTQAGTELARLAQGTIRGRMFYQINSTSLMINGMIYRANAGNDTGAADARSAYNLTITPRS